MRVIVACEESQRVCCAFRELGHEAYSCDIQEPSGGHIEWHILGDALEAIKGGSTGGRDKAMRAHSKYKLKSNRDQKTRSKTFHGIARAMAEQWGG